MKQVCVRSLKLRRPNKAESSHRERRTCQRSALNNSAANEKERPKRSQLSFPLTFQRRFNGSIKRIKSISEIRMLFKSTVEYPSIRRAQAIDYIASCLAADPASLMVLKESHPSRGVFFSWLPKRGETSISNVWVDRSLFFLSSFFFGKITNPRVGDSWTSQQKRRGIKRGRWLVVIDIRHLGESVVKVS